MDISGFLVDRALALVPALYLIGLALKATPFVRDWLIPLILMPLGVCGAMLLMGACADAAIQGILCAGAAVYTDQVIKQTIRKED